MFFIFALVLIFIAFVLGALLKEFSSRLSILEKRISEIDSSAAELAQLVFNHHDRISDLEELSDIHIRNIVDIIEIGPENLRWDGRDAGNSAERRGYHRKMNPELVALAKKLHSRYPKTGEVK